MASIPMLESRRSHLLTADQMPLHEIFPCLVERVISSIEQEKTKETTQREWEASSFLFFIFPRLKYLHNDTCIKKKGHGSIQRWRERKL